MAITYPIANCSGFADDSWLLEQGKHDSSCDMDTDDSFVNQVSSRFYSFTFCLMFDFLSIFVGDVIGVNLKKKILWVFCYFDILASKLNFEI